MNRSEIVEKLPFTLGGEYFIVSYLRNVGHISIFFVYALWIIYSVIYLKGHFSGTQTIDSSFMYTLLFFDVYGLFYVGSTFYEHVFSVRINRSKFTISRNIFCFGTTCEVHTKDIKKIQTKKRPSGYILRHFLYKIEFIEIITFDPETSEERVVRFPVSLLNTNHVDGLYGKLVFGEFLHSITSDVDFSEFDLA